mgnify:CR=1 FL=1
METHSTSIIQFSHHTKWEPEKLCSSIYSISVTTMYWWCTLITRSYFYLFCRTVGDDWNERLPISSSDVRNDILGCAYRLISRYKNITSINSLLMIGLMLAWFISYNLLKYIHTPHIISSQFCLCIQTAFSILCFTSMPSSAFQFLIFKFFKCVLIC